jgi:hypothetical protein
MEPSARKNIEGAEAMRKLDHGDARTPQEEFVWNLSGPYFNPSDTWQLVSAEHGPRQTAYCDRSGSSLETAAVLWTEKSSPNCNSPKVCSAGGIVPNAGFVETSAHRGDVMRTAPRSTSIQRQTVASSSPSTQRMGRLAL